MKMNWQKCAYFSKKVGTVLLGFVFVHFLTILIMQTPLVEILHEIGEAEMKGFFDHIDREIFSSLIRLYIISYILFYFLPDKIRKSKWYLRMIYFLLFYLFCILVYLWI